MHARSTNNVAARYAPRAILRAAAVCLAVGGNFALAAEQAQPSPEGIEFFESKIRPLLVQNCHECHGPKKQQGGLRLDSHAAALKGGDSGAVIAPGDPAGSPLVEAIGYNDEPKMPPKGKLPPEAIDALTKWIQLGAPWPAEAAPVAADVAADAAKNHWAFQPVVKPELPEVKDAGWVRGPVDRFILARLEQEGIAPGPMAGRGTLLRRVMHDLVGLPATAEEAEAFAADDSPHAFANLVDRLLASPAYGERWARHWLDVARYADTKGYVFMEDRRYPNAYVYRDWVVKSLNTDLPYDQFLLDQIAADRLAGEDKSSLAAMGFLTVGRRFLNNRHDIIDDRLDVLCRGTMALTVSCARCHDHKFDPIPTADYYSLHGIFDSTVEPKEPSGMMTLADGPRPRNSRVFVRGNPGNPGPEVPRQFLAVLSGKERKPFQDGSGRLELAKAIASPDNPLTARVIVNRVWLHHFGAGLVRTPSDFGLRSDPPSHPELLDYLAARFVEEGWSLKWLHRQIMLSSVYQQASREDAELRRRDPINRWLWTYNRRRLDFEALRDAMLAASGSLDRTVGGASVDILSVDCRRRTLYATIDRQNLPGLLRTFDFASPDTHSPQRFVTTVPQQALFMMNSKFAGEQARRLAERVVKSESEPAARVERLYRLALARSPSAEESQAGRDFIAAESAEPPGEVGAWRALAQALLMTNEFAFVD